jgi:hypothetical protein
MLNLAMVALMVKHLGQYYMNNEKFMKSGWTNQISVSVWLAAMFAILAGALPVNETPVRTVDLAGMALCMMVVGVEYIMQYWYRSVRRSTIYIIKLTEKKGLHRSLLMCRSFMVMHSVYLILLVFCYMFVDSNADKFIYP